MIRLTVKLVSDFSYAANVREFPVDIEISTDVPTEIYSRIDVRAALLTRPGDEDACFGFARNIFPGKRDLIAFVPQELRRMRVDVFEPLDDFEDYVSGTYILDITVLVCERAGEKISHLDLCDSLEVAVA